MENIESESKFFWKLFKDLLLLPITLILVIFKKKRFDDLVHPFKDLLKFIFEPKVTITLVIINIVIYFTVSILYSMGVINNIFINSYLINTTDHFLNFRIVPIVGSWFFHASLLHLFSNMLFLFILGRVVEREVGPGKTLAIYFGAAIISTILDNVIHISIIPVSEYASLGASGAISGLGGAALLLNPFYFTYLVLGIPLPIIAVVFLQIYSDITGIFNPTDNIGHIAHLGGYLSVAITLYALGEKEKMKKGMLICLSTIAIFILIYFLFRKYFNGLVI
ncbi:MAG: rhomboid family intramembrane serine protease [Nanoarchaeota archaeon]